MSDKTVFNQDLVLNKLVVSNSTDSEASGYVAQSTTITPAGITSGAISTSEIVLTATGFADVSINNTNGTVYTPDNLGVDGSITTNSSISVANTLTILTGVGSPDDVVLSCPVNDILNVGGSVNATAINLGNTVTITNGVGNPNDVILSCSANNTLNVAGTVETTSLALQSTGNPDTILANISGIISSNNAIATNSYVNALTFGVGMVSAVWTPATPIICAPGLYTGTTCVISNFPTNVVATSCAFFFQLQSPNATGGCVPISVPTYTVVQAGTNVTLGIFISNAPGASGATIENISILIVNPAYTASAP
jgi:hypothetical protein